MTFIDLAVDRDRRAQGSEFLHCFGNGGDAGFRGAFVQDRDLQARGLVGDDVNDDEPDDRRGDGPIFEEPQESRIIALVRRIIHFGCGRVGLVAGHNVFPL